jgi:hypothetical protein
MDIRELLKNLGEGSRATRPLSLEELMETMSLRLGERSVRPPDDLVEASETKRLLELTRRPSNRPVVGSPRPKPPPRTTPIVNRGSQRVVVRRQCVPYWQERGWVRQGHDYQGCYRTRFGSWKGRAEVGASGVARMFICNPPAVLEDHPNWPCFFMRRDGWYHIHTHNPFGLSEGILRIEEILTEAHGS